MPPLYKLHEYTVGHQLKRRKQNWKSKVGKLCPTDKFSDPKYFSKSNLSLKYCFKPIDTIMG